MLIGVVLLQKGKGGGLSSAFGGGAGSAFGTKTGDVMTWVTIVITGLFLVLSIGTAVAYRPEVVPVSEPTISISNSGGKVSSKTEDYRIQFGLKESDSKAELYYTTDSKDPTYKTKKEFTGKKVKPGAVISGIAQGATVKVISVNKACNPKVSKVVELKLPFFGEKVKKAPEKQDPKKQPKADAKIDAEKVKTLPKKSEDKKDPKAEPNKSEKKDSKKAA